MVQRPTLTSPGGSLKPWKRGGLSWEQTSALESGLGSLRLGCSQLQAPGTDQAAAGRDAMAYTGYAGGSGTASLSLRARNNASQPLFYCRPGRRVGLGGDLSHSPLLAKGTL